MLGSVFVTASLALAKQFEIFDGQLYNGLYYPRVDIIEWGEPPHMEFHIYSKDKQIELSAVPAIHPRSGKPVLWLMYDLRFRDERICRHVVAPAHYKEGAKVYAYKDSTLRDYENIYVSLHPLEGKNLVPYRMPAYEPCADEMASNMPGAAAPSGAARAPASASSPAGAPDPAKGGDRKLPIDYDNSAVPFSF
ncbi:MAG: hypothetical protein HUU37_03345 [Bdellovibrionales bacterium]|nr:hypothetical protein [Bdellovibrionales bacterium]